MIEMKPLEKQNSNYIIGIPLSSGFYLFVDGSAYGRLDLSSEYNHAMTYESREEAEQMILTYPEVPGAFVVLEVITKVSVKEVEPRSNT